MHSAFSSVFIEMDSYSDSDSDSDDSSFLDISSLASPSPVVVGFYPLVWQPLPTLVRVPGRHKGCCNIIRPIPYRNARAHAVLAHVKMDSMSDSRSDSSSDSSSEPTNQFAKPNKHKV
jgi:hypothetical protein